MDDRLKAIIEKDDASFLRAFGRRSPVCFDHGNGLFLYDTEGKAYMDLIGGIAVNVLGHAHPHLVSAIAEQAGKLIHCSNLYYIENQAILAERLGSLFGGGRVFFANSGAEANEAAIKLVRRYHSQIVKDGRYEIICFRNAFHGRTLMTLAATGTDMYKKGFEPLAEGFKHAEFNNIASVERLLTKKTAAIMVEPVQGEAGVYPATAAFMRGLAAIRKKHNVQLIFDEVQCGLGRTGRMFAFEHYRIKPDIVTIAKPIGGGLPLGVMMATGKVIAGFEPGTHATTFGAGPVVCSAALAFIDELLERGLLENLAAMGGYFAEKLMGLKKRRPGIVDVRARGLMIGIEIVADATEGANFFRENGMLINAIRKNIIRILPPFTVTKTQADMFIRLLEKYLEKAWAAEGGKR